MLANIIGNTIGRRRAGVNWSAYWASRTPSDLILTVLSDTSIKLDWTDNGDQDYGGYSIERSSDAINYTEINTVLIGTETYTDTGLASNGIYYYRIRAFKTTEYSGYSNISSNYYFTLTAVAGNTSRSMMELTVSEPITIKFDGNVSKFYDNDACTVNPTNSRTLTVGNVNTLYFKVENITEKMRVSDTTKIIKFHLSNGSYAPIFSGDVSKFINIEYIDCTKGDIFPYSQQSYMQWSGSIEGLTKLYYFDVERVNNTITGAITGLTLLTRFRSTSTAIGGVITDLINLEYYNCPSNVITGSISNLIKLTYLKCGNKLTGSVTNLTQLTYLEGECPFTGSIDNLLGLEYVNIELTATTISGSITNKTALTNFFLGTCYVTGDITNLINLTRFGSSSFGLITGEIKDLVNLGYFHSGGNTVITCSNATLLTKLSYLRINTTVTLSASNVNQILADFWLNRDMPKTYTLRVIDIVGSNSSDMPSGQGLIDLANLRAYRSPTPPGTAALWSVSVMVQSVFFVGTSITVSSLPDRFATVFCGLNSYVERNLGISGLPLRTNGENIGLEDMAYTVLPQYGTGGTYLFIEIGTNDPDIEENPTLFLNAYKYVLSIAIGVKGWSPYKIKLLTTFLTNGYNYTLANQLIRDAAATYTGIQVIDTGMALYNNGDYAQYMADYIHPNSAGHLLMAQTIQAAIV